MQHLEGVSRLVYVLEGLEESDGCSLRSYTSEKVVQISITGMIKVEWKRSQLMLRIVDWPSTDGVYECVAGCGVERKLPTAIPCAHMSCAEVQHDSVPPDDVQCQEKWNLEVNNRYLECDAILIRYHYKDRECHMEKVLALNEAKGFF